MVSEAIAKGSLQAINYFVADKYVQALKALASAPNQKVMILPMESAGILGSLTGIGEIAREAFGGRGGAAAPKSAT
jgi:regulator of protease activity HflC (stomatin/prohibitin superfamily)